MKSLLFTLAHVAVGIFILWAIWPALQGSNDGYMTKTEGVVITEVDSAPATQPVSKLTPTPELSPQPMSESTLAPKPTLEPVPESVSVAEPVNNNKEDKKIGTLYSVVDGNKLDADSYAGFKLFRNWCARCHGTYGQGMAGPSLPESLKIISKEQFFKTVEEGKTGTIGSMPAWKTNPKVMAGLDKIYAYLMARSDGAIGEVKPKKQ